MAHNLMIDNEGSEEQFVHFIYASEAVGQPWHGLGIEVPATFTPEEGFKRLGGFMEVRLVPLYFRGEGWVEGLEDLKVSQKGRLILSQRGEEFAVVGPSYTAMQEETLARIASIAMGGEAKVRTLGRLGRGERVFLGCDVGAVTIESPTEAGFERVFNHKLVIESTHDASGSLIKRLTTIDPVCQNTLNMGRDQAKAEIRIKHTVNVEKQAEVVAKALAETGVLVDRFEKAIHLLMSYTVPDMDTVVAYSKLLFPHASDDNEDIKLPKTIAEKREFFQFVYATSPGCAGAPETGFRLYSAATYLNDTYLRSRSIEGENGQATRRRDWSKTEFQPAAQEFRSTAFRAVQTLMSREEGNSTAAEEPEGTEA